MEGPPVIKHGNETSPIYRRRFFPIETSIAMFDSRYTDGKLHAMFQVGVWEIVLAMQVMMILNNTSCRKQRTRCWTPFPMADHT